MLNSKREAIHALERILKSGCYRHLFMSYSNESLISHESLMSLFRRYGEVSVREQSLRRYNTLSADDPRAHSCTHVKERLYYLKPCDTKVQHSLYQADPIAHRLAF